MKKTHVYTNKYQHIFVYIFKDCVFEKKTEQVNNE